MREKVLEAATYIARRQGLRNMTRDQVALQAKVSAGSVSNAYEGIEGLRNAVVAEAIRQRDLPILADALGMRLRAAYAAPEEMRTAALATLATPVTA